MSKDPNRIARWYSNVKKFFALERGMVDHSIPSGKYYGSKGYKSFQEIEHNNKAVELNPYDPKAYNNRGCALAANGDLDLAIADFNRAIQLDPFFFRCLLRL